MTLHILLEMLIILFLIISFLSSLSTVQQFHAEQHPRSRDSDFIWRFHFAWWKFDSCQSFFITFSLCNSEVPFEHASKHNNSGFFFSAHQNFPFLKFSCVEFFPFNIVFFKRLLNFDAVYTSISLVNLPKHHFLVIPSVLCLQQFTSSNFLLTLPL